MEARGDGKVEIVLADSGERLEQVRALFEEYWTSFGFTPCFQGFSQELAELPGRYGEAGGRLGLALLGGGPVGCVALRRIDDRRAEAKRLYVRPNSRGMGVGRALVNWIVSQARGAGYQDLLGDTLPVMDRALGMYERMGFERTEACLEEPAKDAICLRLRL